MTPEEFKTAMEEHAKSGDTECMHADMDKLMCKVLTDLGYGDGVEVFKKEPKWYA